MLTVSAGSAWTYDDLAGEYCESDPVPHMMAWALLIKKDLHIFGEKQADVNWDNENVRKELYEVLRWWLDRGVDGFRVREYYNVIHRFRDEPAAYRQLK